MTEGNLKLEFDFLDYLQTNRMSHLVESELTHPHKHKPHLHLIYFKQVRKYSFYF